PWNASRRSSTARSGSPPAPCPTRRRPGHRCGLRRSSRARPEACRAPLAPSTTPPASRTAPGPPKRPPRRNRMLQKLKKTVKDVLAVPAVRKAYEAGNRAVLGTVGSNRLAATLYSFPGFATFNREQYAVLAGRRAYYAHLNQARPTHVELRRNIHRLEKGIQ